MREFVITQTHFVRDSRVKVIGNQLSVYKHVYFVPAVIDI